MRSLLSALIAVAVVATPATALTQHRHNQTHHRATRAKHSHRRSVFGQLHRATSRVSDGSLLGGSYYTNSRGNRVHRPVYRDRQPIDATAKCRDGSWSFSQSHRGTCSHHGGVAAWL